MAIEQSEEDRRPRVDLAGGYRSGNPRPVGRTLPVISASGFGPYSDVRTSIASRTPQSADAVVSTRAPLQAYVNTDGISITPGFVNGIVPLIGTTPIDALVAPILPLSTGDNFIHLIGTFTPSVYAVAGSFAVIGSGGEVSAVSFVSTASATPSPAETYPIVSGSSATDGHFDILWAVVNVDNNDVITIEIPSGGGDAQIVFMPPDLYVAFRNTNI